MTPGEPAKTRSDGEQKLATPSISLPKGGGAIRGMGEKFAANPVTGTGSMSVPIATSPGRSGFGPELSLTYDSGAGNGPFGLGWSLSLPQITRKTDKGLPQYNDAGESDVFILSGSEDLVPVLNADGSRYEDTATAPGNTIHRYRPRIEGLFARIERWTNTATGEIHWRSITRDNVTTVYGKDNNSRIFDPAAPDPAHPTRIFSWLICQSYDDKGNAIVYEYAGEDDRNVDRSQANERSRVRTANRYLKRGRNVDNVVRLVAEPVLFVIKAADFQLGHFVGEFVSQYAQSITQESYPEMIVIDEGKLFLNQYEDEELNDLLPTARDYQSAAFVLRQIAPTMALIPDFPINIHYWGIGATIVFGGSGLTSNMKTAADVWDHLASRATQDAGIAARTASYERRADDWMLQSNLAARELMQIGRQIISSLIREQITRHEYESLKKQIEQAQEIDQFLQEKFTNEELYGWMQGELSKLYYEYYKFAFDIARKAEQTMKHELMRPELDELNFVKFNYWDGGRKGLLSGEALHLDLKRMEMAYHDHNKREYELTKHVSIRQLSPVALLTLKATGACEVTLPEWLFDLDAPGHYMRRIKNVSLSIPAVTGPYTGVNCTLSLLKSTLRRSPELRDGEYKRATDEEDSRLVDYYGTVQSIVTSNAQNDSGMFEPNLRDERFLPFEGAGAESTWRLELPKDFRQFDYNTISDIIVHVRYTARQGGDFLRQKATAHLRELIEEANTSGLAQLFSLKHDFSSEWHRFLSSQDDFRATVKKEYFPYFVQGKVVNITRVELYAIEKNAASHSEVVNVTTNALQEDSELEIFLPESSVLKREKEAQVFLLFRYTIG